VAPHIAVEGTESVKVHNPPDTHPEGTVVDITASVAGGTHGEEDYCDGRSWEDKDLGMVVAHIGFVKGSVPEPRARRSPGKAAADTGHFRVVEILSRDIRKVANNRLRVL
jgi:hypothetical protein